MNFYPVNFGKVTDRQTESDAYEPTVQCAQVGSKIEQVAFLIWFQNLSPGYI